jgi:hypothetical protein
VVELPDGFDALYEIDPVAVAASVERAIANTERFRARDHMRPKPWPGCDLFHDGRNRREREYYAKVMIARQPGTRKPYVLVYDGDFTQLTGGFRTIQEAALWFVNGGR